MLRVILQYVTTFKTTCITCINIGGLRQQSSCILIGSKWGYRWACLSKI